MRRTTERLQVIPNREQRAHVELISEFDLRRALEFGFIHAPYQFRLLGPTRLEVEMGEAGCYLRDLDIPIQLTFNPETAVYTISKIYASRLFPS